ncbi:MAG: hypothetical protein SGPRY_010220 [Prymnesium sp.]
MLHVLAAASLAMPRHLPRVGRIHLLNKPQSERQTSNAFHSVLALAAIEAAVKAERVQGRISRDFFNSVINVSAVREYDFREALQASHAYSWSLKSLESSQGAAADAYSWSVETASAAALSIQSIGHERLQSLGLLPHWLSDPLDQEEEDEEESSVLALAMLVVFALESIGPVHPAPRELTCALCAQAQLRGCHPF